MPKPGIGSTKEDRRPYKLPKQIQSLPHTKRKNEYYTTINDHVGAGKCGGTVANRSHLYNRTE